MSVHETIDKATGVVVEAETRYLNAVVKQYENAQHQEDDEALDFWLEEMCKEKDRTDHRGKYDQEEVFIALYERRNKK